MVQFHVSFIVWHLERLAQKVRQSILFFCLTHSEVILTYEFLNDRRNISDFINKKISVHFLNLISWVRFLIRWARFSNNKGQLHCSDVPFSLKLLGNDLYLFFLTRVFILTETRNLQAIEFYFIYTQITPLLSVVIYAHPIQLYFHY